MDQFWIVTSYLTLIFAALVTTGLVVTYGISTQWDKTQVGRQFMLTKACLAVVFDYWVLAVIINPQTSYVSTMPIRVLICASIGFVMLRWLIILIRAQRQARRKQHEDLRS